jgi:alkanesulfonate monooxygenase
MRSSRKGALNLAVYRRDIEQIFLSDLKECFASSRRRATLVSKNDSNGQTCMSLRLGIWLPVQGTWGSLTGESLDSSYERNRTLLLTAEAGGIATALLAQHLSCPYGQEHDQLEAWTAAAALAEATTRVEIIAAVKPLYFHPAILAKLALGIDGISKGRFAINLVSGWFLPELTRTGLANLEHDDRYRYSQEWVSVVRTLMRGDQIEHKGEFFELHELYLRPRPSRVSGPRIYVGGESAQGRGLAAATADVFLMNGRPLAQLSAVLADVSSRPRPLPHALQFGMSAFVIARPTRAEADAEFDRLLKLTTADDFSEVFSKADSKAAMFKLNTDLRAVGTNGGTASGLVGSYEEVAERMAQFHDAGIGTFMLQFQPIEPELDRFVAEIVPRLRRLVDIESGAASAPGVHVLDGRREWDGAQRSVVS